MHRSIIASSTLRSAVASARGIHTTPVALRTVTEAVKDTAHNVSTCCAIPEAVANIRGGIR